MLTMVLDDLLLFKCPMLLHYSAHWFLTVLRYTRFNAHFTQSNTSFFKKIPKYKNVCEKKYFHFKTTTHATYHYIF